ncbi:hypothetical protein REL12_016765 [Clostridioides difficile]|uniref:hypothetical protein n=1 Tax=Clostridioides difficile TaxID=1496 RepID=UPI0008A5725C|nr:hypothetical protein [Clostridioides difficile]OFU01859.1 hypothetical protein HMPREF3083_15355 [Clostridium sp. HMSC19D07]EGT4533156.1 hypothetical protein [Clostridioides difficile]EGT4838071.1 hypothetical protein [Clostridioides difficile]EGT4913436.1 hypothetical protein [Clostridioides difficile]EGT5505406.1 hypothetical protein [Clostridioides difficile]
MSEDIFYGIKNTLDDIAEVQIKNKQGVLKEVGMLISDDENSFITHCLDEDLIKFYIEDEEVLTIDKDNHLLYMLDALFYNFLDK